MRKTTCFVFLAALVAVLPLTLSPLPVLACDGPDCEVVSTSGLVDINANQNLYRDTGLLDLNHPKTVTSGWQQIWAGGQGDSETTVSAMGKLIQLDPYNETRALAIGEATHQGEAFQFLMGAAGTDALCDVFEIDLWSERSHSTENNMDAGTMSSWLTGSANTSLRLEGAPGSLDWGVLNDQVHGYTFTRDDGASQIGVIRTTIQGGNVPAP